MARDGSGAYSLPAGNPVTTGTSISSTVQNATMSDVAAAITQSLAKDGQTTPVGNLPMGGFRHTGVADGVGATDYASKGQMDTALALKQSIAAAFGAGQTWQSPVRVLNTNYTNSTGKAIFVSANVSSSADFNGLAYVDGVQVVIASHYAGKNTNVHFAVPPGSLYQVQVSAGTPILSSWTELR